MLTQLLCVARGPTGTLLAQLADASFADDNCRIILVCPKQATCHCLHTIRSEGLKYLSLRQSVQQGSTARLVQSAFADQAESWATTCFHACRLYCKCVWGARLSNGVTSTRYCTLALCALVHLQVHDTGDSCESPSVLPSRRKAIQSSSAETLTDACSVYLQSLTVLEYLLKNGSEQCVSLTNSEILFKLEDLEAFEYVSPDGKDQGINVRLRCGRHCHCRLHCLRSSLHTVGLPA